jgi:hypothetical protein
MKAAAAVTVYIRLRRLMFQNFPCIFLDYLRMKIQPFRWVSSLPSLGSGSTDLKTCKGATGVLCGPKIRKQEALQPT